MGIAREIERAVKKLISLDENGLDEFDKKVEENVDKVQIALENNSLDFGNLKSQTLTQNGKKRFIKSYEDIYSEQNILCQTIKQILDRSFKLKYPNRKKITASLFNILPAAIQMLDFTIVKFDFKDYFNSISSLYVFEKYLKSHISDREAVDLIKTFAESTKYAYAGLPTSNAIAEIIAVYFDEALKRDFFQNGIIYYERYIDDSVLILNEYMSEEAVKNKLNNILSTIYHDRTIESPKCRTKFNEKKFKYITRRNITSDKCTFDFLGYEFIFSKKEKNSIDLKYGITEEKRNKYIKRVDRLISSYKDANSEDYNNLELLRHRIAAFSSRTVYVTKHYNSHTWKVKGFISNYGELRYFLDTKQIDEETKKFLKNMIKNAFEKADIKPYFLHGGGYNLFENMKVNKTILLVDRIGYDYKSLVKLCNQVGIKSTDKNDKQRGYGTLVRQYLIRINVGF